jgi:hypothetical protein
MRFVTGFAAPILPRVSVPISRASSAERRMSGGRWTPTPRVTLYAAGRPAALVPLCWVTVMLTVAGLYLLPLLPAAAVTLTLAVLAGRSWAVARREAARRNSELSQLPGRHARVGAGH